MHDQLINIRAFDLVDLSPEKAKNRTLTRYNSRGRCLPLICYCYPWLQVSLKFTNSK